MEALGRAVIRMIIRRKSVRAFLSLVIMILITVITMEILTRILTSKILVLMKKRRRRLKRQRLGQK